MECEKPTPATHTSVQEQDAGQAPPSTILSTLSAASDEQEEQFSGIKAVWVARRARQLASPPTSPSPSEAVAALSQRVVPQLASPIQLEEECRLAPRRLVGEHGGTGIVAALDTAASYIASSVCDCAIRRRRARSRDMQAEKEAAADVDEVMRLRGCGRGDGQHVPARRHH